MPERYDVVIVGAGPAGLRCAEVLSTGNLSVVVLEKNGEIGPKICAGGITARNLKILNIPRTVFEKGIAKAELFSPHFTCETRSNSSLVYMTDRRMLGKWQLEQVKKENVTVRTGSKVTAVTGDYVEINGKERIRYRYLVGADGANSTVRKYLNLPVKKRLATLQYRIPAQGGDKIGIYMHSRYFKAWYAWVFPHNNELVVGCAAHPAVYPPKRMKENFQSWLRKKGFDVTGAKYESFPINYDYRGYRFGNRFLAGEAAGLASGLTGEGIYQALVSGEEVAKLILDPAYKPQAMESLLRYNRIHHTVLKLLVHAGMFRNFLFDLIVLLMRWKPVNRYITKGFSGVAG